MYRLAGSLMQPGLQPQHVVYAIGISAHRCWVGYRRGRNGHMRPNSRVAGQHASSGGAAAQERPAGLAVQGCQQVVGI